MKKIKSIIDTSTSATLAGICISVGCIVNLSVGGIAGAIFFTFGLLTVVHYGYKLYTGTAGFCTDWRSIMTLFVFILTFNIIGCLLAAEMTKIMNPEIIEKASDLLSKRESVDWLASLFRGLFCGFLMTTAVYFGRQHMFLPLLFAVPVFILSGFYHSIADSFYYLVSDTALGLNYFMVIVGNFIGCNLYRLETTFNT